MTSERQLESNPYLKARGESQLRARHSFDRRAGWHFGFVIGILLVSAAYGWDALQLLVLHAEFWWVRLALACITIFPLAILVGGISGYVHWLLKVPLWALFGIASAWCAVHIPFEGAQILLRVFDSNLRLADFLQAPPSIQDSFNTLVILGVALGVLIGLLQTFLVNWAWEYSSEENGLTVRGWVYLLLAAPLALGLAFLFDSAVQAPLRMPLETINAAVQSGLNDLPGQDPNQMEADRTLVYLTGQRWREQFTRSYILHLAAADANETGESVTDVTFDNGFNWRCRVLTNGALKDPCYDLNAEYVNYVTAFVGRGTFQCIDCQGLIAAPADAWQTRNKRTLGANDKLMVKHNAGSTVAVRLAAQGNQGFECVLSGANPVVIQVCR